MGAKGRFVASIAGAGAALLVSASAAFAEARFASPSGTSLNPCTLVAPCDIVTALKGAAPKDDITIEPGIYGPIPTPLSDEGKTLTIHGQAGAPRPVILSSTTLGIFLSGENSSLSDLEFDVPAANSTGVGVGAIGVSIDRVISHVLGGSSIACQAFVTVTVTNSLCVVDGPGPKSYAFRFTPVGGTATLRNDTFEAPGGAGPSGGVALLTRAETNHQVTVTLSNSIAHGANVDLLATADNNASSEAKIAADHSNYLTESAITEGAGKSSVTVHGTETNQTSAPHFVNGAADDFHEVAGSPTIGAGFNSPTNGMLDLDGNPRQFGGNVDIGAYQFIPPATAPVPPTGAGAGAAVPAGGGATPAPSDSQPVLSPATFATLSSGPSVIARAAKGTTISYTDTQVARTTFVVRRPAGKGLLAHGKCVKPPRKRKGGSRGKSCTIYSIFGSFTHSDTAGTNRFRFSGRLGGRALKPGSYQLVSAPTNASGKTGATHVNNFKIVNH